MMVSGTMVYREGKGAEGATVVWGPFPMKPLRVATALGLFLMAAVVTMSTVDEERFDCLRADDLCVYERPTFGDHTEVRLSAITHVHFETTGDAGDYGLLEVSHQGGTLTFVTERAPEVRGFYDAFERFRRSDQPRFHGTIGRTPLQWLIVLAFLVGGLGSMLSGLLPGGRVALTVDAANRVLRVRHTTLGVPRGAGLHPLEDLEDVQLEWREHRDLMWGRGAAADVQSRLVLVYRTGARVPVTREHHTGYTLHRIAEAALRDALSLEPRPPELAASLAAEAAKWVPAPLAAKARKKAILRAAGMGALGGTLFLASVGLLVGAFHWDQIPPPWLLAAGSSAGAITGALIAWFVTRARPLR
jgi:hypothetical protein